MCNMCKFDCSYYIDPTSNTTTVKHKTTDNLSNAYISLENIYGL